MSVEAFFRQATGLALPADAQPFWDFCTRLDAEGLDLAGPPLGVETAPLFEAFADIAGADSDLLRQGRFLDDPPEFITALLGSMDGLHWGWYVDDPAAGPACVAHYYHSDAFEPVVSGGNLFGALANYVDDVIASLRDTLALDAANRATYEQDIERAQRIGAVLAHYPQVREARRAAVAPTREGMGVVAPPDTYRPVEGMERFFRWDFVPSPDEVRALDAQARALLTEGYPASTLQIAKNLWAYREIRSASVPLLDAAYEALNRPALRLLLRQAADFQAKRRRA